MLALLFIILLTTSAVAQQLPAQSPSDLEIIQAEAKAAESRALYYEVLIRKQAATAKETADYWAAYIGERKDEH